MNMTHYDYALTGFYTSFNLLLLPVFNLMFGSYYARYFFKLKTSQEREQLGSDLLSIRIVFNIIELCFILLAFAIYAYLQKIEFPVFPYSIISFSTIMFNTIYDFFLLKLKMQKNATGFFKISVYHAFVILAFSIFLVVLLKQGALGKLLAPMFTAIIFAVFLYPKIVSRFNFDKDLAKEALKFCWPLIASGSLGYFFTGFDRVLLVNLDDTFQLGLYNVAIMISGYLMIFQTSINNTFQPDLFNAVAQNNKKKLIMVLGGIQILNILPITFFIVFAPIIIKLLTADRFTDAYTYARILSLRNITSGLYYSMAGIIVAYGYPRIDLISKIVGSIISIFLFKILISKFEYYGAAWGQVISFAGMTIVGIIALVLTKRKKLFKWIKGQKLGL